jgi:hypothetical protein
VLEWALAALFIGLAAHFSAVFSISGRHPMTAAMAQNKPSMIQKSSLR